METNTDTPKENTTPYVMSAPRAPWMEFILHFSTFGVYTCFWMVKRTQEIKLLSNKPLTPWAWFFVPHILFVQFFTLPKFTAAINKLEKQYHIKPWGKIGNIGWIVGVITMTGLFNFTNNIELPGWTLFVFLCLFALLFSFFQIRINRIKQAVSHIQFTKPKSGYSTIEWSCLVLLFPLTFSLLGYLAIEPMLATDLQALDNGSVYTDPEGAYQFKVVGENWSIVENKTFSDGSAELELKGALTDMYFLVFFYGHNEDINSLAVNRFDEAHEYMSSVSCTEKRLLSKKQLSVISRSICNGSFVTDPTLLLSTIIETKKGIYEFYGYLHSVKYSFVNYKKDFVTMAEGFEPL